MRRILKWFIRLRAQGLSKADEHPVLYSSVQYVTLDLLPSSKSFWQPRTTCWCVNSKLTKITAYIAVRDVDPYGTGGTCPPHNILEVMSLGCRLNCDSNCCLLYFNAYIMCSFTKKFQLLGDFAPDPLSGLRPCTPLGSPDPSLFLCPPIILWDRRPW